jgi:hypothetical protein
MKQAQVGFGSKPAVPAMSALSPLNSPKRKSKTLSVTSESCQVWTLVVGCRT